MVVFDCAHYFISLLLYLKTQQDVLYQKNVTPYSRGRAALGSIPPSMAL